MIRLENISKYYYGFNIVVPALRKIKLEFQVGEFIAITGESGSGKSTLLNIISGLDTYDDGEVYVNGEATSDYDSADWENYRKNKIGFVFQNYNLIEHYSVLNNVESALLIQGYSVKEAMKAAKGLIDKVGLKKQLYQKASRLSSGQKQRLSIARALAKNTDIIIADEPTGNLDSENGKQIMELLSELSKDKLVITVTHNFEEAAPYVTRKIRLHDGEVVSDTLQNQISSENDLEEETNLGLDRKVEPSAKVNSGLVISNNRKVKSSQKIAWRFTRMNITTQPGRVMFYMLFLILTASVSFIFLGDILSNWDDTHTKNYESTFFLNPDDTRIVVKKQDNSTIADQDIEVFNKIKYVKMSDRYDYSNDINYHFTFGTDYEYLYEANDSPQSVASLKTVDLINYTHFMKSSTCISQQDLSAGHLPEERNEVVIYSEDPSILGTLQPCYFSSVNAWSYNEYYATEVKIVGILKQNRNQIFFSKELCNMLSLAFYSDHYSLSAEKNIFTNKFTTNINFVPIIGDGLQYNDVKVSTDIAASNSGGIIGEAELNAYVNGVTKTSSVNILKDPHISSVRFVEVNKDRFYELYQKESNQASLYIKDYIYSDYVLKKLDKLGYDAISSFRLSSLEYDYYKITARNATMFKAIFVILIVSLLEVLILRSAMKISNKDFKVLGSMGMEFKTIRQMNYYEMLLYTGVSIFLNILTVNIIGLFHVQYIVNMIKYYNPFTYSIYILLNLVMITVTVKLFIRYLKNKQRWRS